MRQKLLYYCLIVATVTHGGYTLYGNKTSKEMSMTIKGLIAIGLFAGVMATTVGAHPGRTAADGCHYCRTNCGYWGETAGARHCHGGGNHVPGIEDRFMIKTGAANVTGGNDDYPHSHEYLEHDQPKDHEHALLEN